MNTPLKLLIGFFCVLGGMAIGTLIYYKPHEVVTLAPFMKAQMVTQDGKTNPVTIYLRNDHQVVWY